MTTRPNEMAPAHMLRMICHLPRLQRTDSGFARGSILLFSCLAQLFQRAYGLAAMMNMLGRGGTERYGRFRRSRARRWHRGRARRHGGGPGRQVRRARRGRADRRRIPLPGLRAVELAAAVGE